MLTLFRKKTVLKIWTLSYVAILLIIMSANLFIVAKVNVEIQKERDISNKNFLNNVALSFDSIFTDVELFTKEAENNQYVSNLAERDNLDLVTRLDSGNVAGILSDMKIKYKNIMECFIYYPKIDLIVTSQNFCESELYFRMNVENYEEEYLRWKDKKEKTFTEMRVKNKENFSVDVFDAIYPVYDENLQIKFYIHILIDKDNMFEPINNLEIYKDAFCLILDRRGNVLISSNRHNKDENLSNILFYNEYAPAKIKINNEDMIMYNLKSFKFTYRYTYFVPENFWLQNAFRIFLVFLVVNLICISVILLIVVTLSKWNYNKIRNILVDLDDGMGTTDEENEYQAIKNRIEFSKNQRKILQKNLKKQMTIVRNGFLADYIKGYINENIEESFDSYNIKLNEKYYSVIAIYIEDFGILNDDMKRDAVFIINNILEDLANKDKFLMVESDGMMFYIVKCDNNNEKEFKDIIVKTFSDINRLTSEIFGMNFVLGISSIKENVNSIPMLYTEAISALEKGKFYGIDDFVFFNDIEAKNDKNLFYGYPINKNNELLAYIKEGKSENAEALIREFFETEVVAKQMNKWYCDGLIHIIINNILRVDLNIDEKILAKIKEMEMTKTINESVDALCKIISDICKQNEKIDESSNEIYAKVRQYIDENFMDSELNIFEIGERFHMSSYYISRIFKEYSGIKLGKYISDLRIEYAKKLLKENSFIKIEEVAAKTGFQNNRTFLKVFKEKEGITPTQFKNL